MSNGQKLEEQIFQLKQTIIFLKSEISRYQNELQQNNYYEVNIELENENAELKQREKELSLELLRLKRNVEQEQENHQKEIETFKEQKQKLITSIQKLVKEKADLRNENSQFTKEKQSLLNQIAQLIKEKENLLNENTQLTNEKESLLNKNAQLTNEMESLLNENALLANEKETLLNENTQLTHEKENLLNKIEQLNQTLQQTKTEVAIIPNVSTASSENNFEKVVSQFSEKLERQIQHLHDEFKISQSHFNMHISGKIEKEVTEVKDLLHTLKESKHLSPTTSHSNSTSLNDLDNQIHIIYTKAIEFEKRLEEKIQLLHNMEQQLDGLIHDIEKS